MKPFIRIILDLAARRLGYEIHEPASRPEIILLPKKSGDRTDAVFTQVDDGTVNIIQDLLPISEPPYWARGGPKFPLVSLPKAIVIHWVEGPMHTAKGVRDYLATLEGRYSSEHFIVGLKGEIIQMMPLDEAGWHVGAKKYMPGIYEKFCVGTGAKTPNYNTLAIECCHTDWAGNMTPRTMCSLENLCVHLLKQFELTSEDLYLHRDFTGKECHKLFVDNPDLWAELKTRVKERL